MYDYQLTQTKERIAALLTEINEKTDEVERLVKEEKCLVEEDKKNNTCLQDVLAKIVCAEENYVAAQMVVTEANKAHVIRLKVYNDQRDAIANCTNLQQKTRTEDEMEANKVFYTAFDTAQKKLKKAQEFYDNKNKEFNTIVSNKIHELENKQFMTVVIHLFLSGRKFTRLRSEKKMNSNIIRHVTNFTVLEKTLTQIKLNLIMNYIYLGVQCGKIWRKVMRISNLTKQLKYYK